MSKRPRAARSNKHTRPARPAGAPARPAASAATASSAAAAVATQPAPAAPAATTPRAATRPQMRPQARAGLLAEKAANEYVYVARDMRRIGTFAAVVAAIMIVVWVLVDLVHVVAL